MSSKELSASMMAASVNKYNMLNDVSDDDDSLLTTGSLDTMLKAMAVEPRRMRADSAGVTKAIQAVARKGGGK